MQNNHTNKICSAIKSKYIIQFNYEEGKRIVEPYCFGLSREGNNVLRAYQIKGDSRSGKNSGWKLFSASKMKNIQKTKDLFVIGHHYTGEKIIKDKYCCI